MTLNTCTCVSDQTYRSPSFTLLVDRALCVAVGYDHSQQSAVGDGGCVHGCGHVFVAVEVRNVREVKAHHASHVGVIRVVQSSLEGLGVDLNEVATGGQEYEMMDKNLR